MSALDDLVERYGANPAGLLAFDQDVPALLPYATLVATRRAGCPDLSALHAVYEWQDSPLVFLVDGDRLEDDNHLRRIRRRIALSGDAPYLGVVQPGRLTIHAIGLDSASAGLSRIPLAVEAPITFAYLASQRPQARGVRRQWITDLILRLLQGSLGDLRRAGIAEPDAISLAGRALFTRFLADRELLPQTLALTEVVRALFDDPDQTARTSRWLDKTFNGDFLPLSPGLLTRLPTAACLTLGHIMRRAEPGGQLYLGWEQKWDFLDFAQIPVGVLSQAYEGYLREHDPKRQRDQGGFYTPRPIAELLVRGAFHALGREGSAHTARVLDPAVGAGVFLITAFRQLVAERWKHTGIRPDSATLRDILYHQLTGFDIDEAALRFAALGLYLIAIELDPQPEPVEKLRFEDLRERVLWKIDDALGDGSGSLGNAAGTRHAGRYDLVVGNPPWSKGGSIAGWKHVADHITRIARARLGDNTASAPIPNKVLDLPFLWRAMEWARHGGQIALALHARLLFQQGYGMSEARSAIFTALNVTGVVNGTELRDTKVWPQVRAPFCLLFASNRLPPPGAGFRLLSPRLEPSLNGAGIMRLDPANADEVTLRQVMERPTILKTLFRGTRLDMELLERIRTRGMPTLDQYWRRLFGEAGNRTHQAGNGYKRLCESTKNPQSAKHLIGLPELARDGLLPLLLRMGELPRFDQPLVQGTRLRETYRSPLAIVHESPPAKTQRIRVAVSASDVVFNESYCGYSSAGHPDAQTLTRYLALVLGSRFSLWHALLTSGKFGFERDTIEKATIDSVPLVPLEDLSPSDRERIAPLFNSIVSSETDEHWGEVDNWVASLIGLRERDRQLITDTLAYNLPFAANKNAAQSAPAQAAMEAFCRCLAADLMPWANRFGAVIVVAVADTLPANCPWQVLWLGVTESGAQPASARGTDDWLEIVHIADQLAVAELVRPDPARRGLWIARLRQARYWSLSQARLLAQRILWEHMDSLLSGGDA